MELPRSVHAGLITRTKNQKLQGINSSSDIVLCIAKDVMFLQNFLDAVKGRGFNSKETKKNPLLFEHLTIIVK